MRRAVPQAVLVQSVSHGRSNQYRAINYISAGPNADDMRASWRQNAIGRREWRVAIGSMIQSGRREIGPETISPII